MGGMKRSEVSRSGLEIKSLGFFSLFSRQNPKIIARGE
jgi:hypothetical protein